MAIKQSTGLCLKLLGGTGENSFQDIFALGFLRVFSGTVPASADAAETGTLLGEYSVDGLGTGLTFDDPTVVGGVAVLSKAAAETWKTTAVATGNATYYRFVAVGDDGTLSTSQPRVQGTVGVVGTDMILGNVTFTNGADRTLPYFTIALVPS